MKDKLVKFLLSGFFLFNVFDAGSTVYVLDHNLAEELNPFMRALYNSDPYLFVFFKVVMGAAMIMLLWDKRQERGVKIVSAIIFVSYFLLFLYQLVTLVALSTL